MKGMEERTVRGRTKERLAERVDDVSGGDYAEGVS